MKFTAFLISLFVPVLAQAWPGKVVRIVDGDTLLVERLEVAEPEPPVRIRLAAINAPEKRDPEGAAATAALTSLVEDVHLEIKPLKYGKYGRLIAEIKVPGCEGELIDVGETLIATGHAVPVDW